MERMQDMQTETHIYVGCVFYSPGSKGRITECLECVKKEEDRASINKSSP